MEPLPKLCGADIELGNFVLGSDRFGSTCCEASRALLREINGVAKDGQADSSDLSRYQRQSESRGYGWRTTYQDVFEDNPAYTSQDWGRKFLASNGGCAYIDLDHLELCIPEVISAYNHVACWNAMLRIAAKALEAANRKLRGGRKIQVLVNNSDGLGHSYGSHLSFLIARDAWENIFHRKLHHMLFLAAYQVSSIIFTGQGKVGSENGAAPVDFQISQRADFFEQLAGPQTTFDRPLINSRDEPLCGPSPRRFSGATLPERMARLHVILFDNTLCQAASLLKVGVMQIILSMIEHERVHPSLLLDDPLRAIVACSHDPFLRTKLRMASGQMLTAVELQLLFLEEVKRFAQSTDCSEWIPRAGEIISLWEDTLQKLHAGDFPVLARRLDWVLKWTVLQRVIERHPQLDWQSPQVKHLDHVYSSLDPSEGLYWTYAQKGLVEEVVDDQQIDWFVHNPPENTRAWARAMILRRTSQGSVDAVDWDSIRIKTRSKGGWSSYTELNMADPFGFTKDASGHLFDDGMLLEDILERLALEETQDEPAGTREGSPTRVSEPLRLKKTGNCPVH